MENIIRTAGVVIFKYDKVLLVRHGKKAQHLNNTYGLPAGRIKFDEMAVDAAVRELNEETGLIASTENLIKLPKIYTAKIERKDGAKNFSFEVFLCTKFEGKLKSTQEAAPEWVSLNNLGGFSLLVNVDAIIKDALKLIQNN